MNMHTDEVLQWIGAIFVIVGHTLNSIGPETYPWNIVAFLFGTIAFFIWAIRIRSRPQILVNVVALSLIVAGIFNAVL